MTRLAKSEYPKFEVAYVCLWLSLCLSRSNDDSCFVQHLHSISIFSTCGVCTFHSHFSANLRRFTPLPDALCVHSRELLLAASLASCELCRSPLSTFILAFPSASNYNYLWALRPSYSTQTNSESLSPSITLNLPAYCVTKGQLSTWVYLSARGHYVIWYLLLSISILPDFTLFCPNRFIIII